MEETNTEIPSLTEISSSNEMDVKLASSDHNPVSAANEKRELSSDNSKEREKIREETDSKERQNSFAGLKTKWLCEAESFSDSESFLWSKVQYVNQCEDANNCLNYLLSNEMTTVYASVSKLFKSFRSVFASNQKLKNKVFELASQTRSIQKQNEEFEGKVSEREGRIQHLERLVDANISRIQAAEKAKLELESQLEDLRRKREEVDKESQARNETADLQKGSLFQKYGGALKEIDILTLQLTASRNEKERLQAENERSQNVQNELRAEIRALREELEALSRQREEAQIGLLSRNKEAQRQLELTESLKREVQSLKVDLDAARNKSKGLMNDLKSCESKLKDATRHCNLLNKNLAARQFHLTVLKTQKAKLEECCKEKHDEAESLKSAMSKVTSMKNDLARRVSLFGQKLANLELEKQRGSSSFQQEERDIVWRREAGKNKEIGLLKLEIKKLHIELNSASETLKRRTASLKTQETVCAEAKKEVVFFHRESQELKKKIRFLEDEKQKMSTEISQLTTVHSDMQNQLQTMEQNDIAKDQEISLLKQDIEKGKERIRFYSNNEYATRKQLQKTKDKLREALSLHQAFTESTQQQIERIRKFEDHVQMLQKQVIALKVTNNDVKCTMKQLERQNSELSAQVECKERDYKGTLKTLEETGHELEVAKVKIQCLSVEKSRAEYKLAENQKELAKKKEQAECLAIDFSKVENAVKEKENEIQIFKVEVESLRRSLSVAKKELQERESMQKQLVKAQTLFDGERLKCKALEEELQRPRNLHRWRSLEGTDTPIQHLMLKCVHLQKMLMKKSNLLSKKENELRNKEKVIEELAADRKRRSELEAQKKLWSCQKELSDCKNEIKCLLGEKFVYESLSSKHVNQIKNLKNELRRAKPSRCQHDAKDDEFTTG
ncbi:hypothetical protein AVEN_90165-1 [Araneus ventricosus]|uniref:Uncharacterized protein n=1 Tax=Araneus ventricosus TaxID=182803 RepID=A0A4Y2H742_ARAVE|nr:hypothetical protein AVEN_90165-1 [Araneus ventricosus]